MKLEQALLGYGLLQRPSTPVDRPKLEDDDARWHQQTLWLNELRSLQQPQRQPRRRAGSPNSYAARVRRARIAWLRQEIERGV